MPMRTWLPTISITWTEMSSPRMIFSPGRRVMISTRPGYPDAVPSPRPGRVSGRLALGPGEQRRPHRGLGGLVDDLVAAAVVDDDRGPEVRGEVAPLGRGPHRHPHRDVRRVLGQPGVRGGGVGELEGVLGE